MNRPPGQVRIIAGRLRGSKLPVADSPGLRPSPDRVRETLFNWLQGRVAGARAIDLFAGTGALGFEAVSRGAADVLMLERDPALASGLRAQAQRLQCPEARIECVDALAWLARSDPGPNFDLAFLDPPFSADLWQASAAALQAHLADGALIHVEAPIEVAYGVPAGWRLHREARTRELRHALYVKEMC